MDGPYAAVKFPPKDCGIQGAVHTKEVISSEEATSLLQDVRLLRKDELQVREVESKYFLSKILWSSVKRQKIM